MYVLPIQHVLEELDHGHCQFQVYEELKSQDKLVAWESGMKVIFVSQVWLKHDWLDDDHASKFKLLCEVLKDIRAGDFDVQPEFSSAMNKNADKLAFRGADLRRDLSEGYLWIDVCCIPQKSKKKQLPAISSIPNYVASCDYFLVLAGPWVHERGHRCDLNSWMGRGWCRMEQLCNALSPKSKPIIVVRTRQLRSALPPGGQHFRDWLCCPVGLGGFTVPDDRRTLGPTISELLRESKAYHFGQGNHTIARYIHANSCRLLWGTGMVSETESESLSQFLGSLHFASARDGEGDGLSALRFAAMAGRKDLVREMIDEHHADVHAVLRKADPHTTSAPRMNILGQACLLGTDAEMVQLLISRGARVRRGDMHGTTAVHYSCISGVTEVVDHLLGADPALGRLTDSLDWNPLHSVALVGGVGTLKYLHDKYPDLWSRSVAETDAFGLGMVGKAVWLLGQRESVQALLKRGCDVNQFGRAKGRSRLILALADLSFRLGTRSVPLTFKKFDLSNPVLVEGLALKTRTTPLHIASYLGHFSVVRLLLDAGAKQSRHHPHRMTPLDLALRQGHSRIAKELMQHQGESDAPCWGYAGWQGAGLSQSARDPDLLWRVLQRRLRSAVANEETVTPSPSLKSVGKKARVHPQITASVRNMLDQRSNSDPTTSIRSRSAHSARDCSELTAADRPVVLRSQTSFYGRGSPRGSLQAIGEDDDDNKSDAADEEEVPSGKALKGPRGRMLERANSWAEASLDIGFGPTGASWNSLLGELERRTAAEPSLTLDEY